MCSRHYVATYLPILPYLHPPDFHSILFSAHKLSKANHEVLLYTFRSSTQQLVAILEVFFRYIYYTLYRKVKRELKTYHSKKQSNLVYSK